MSKFKTALVIDSDTSSRKFVALRLEILGYRVREAGTPDEIKQALKEGETNLVVSEFAVPGLGGAELLQVLEPAKRTVFLLTQWDFDHSEAFLNETRVKAVIPKKKRSDLFKCLESPPPEDRRPGPVIAKHDARRKQILLIEDSPTIRHQVRRILEKEMPECEIREAEDGKNAISEMAQKKVDFIITDLNMPGMDGRTFLRMIRKNNLLKQKPVLVFSSGDTSDLQAEFGGDSCLEFLPKPASPETIMAAMNRLWECQDRLVKR